MTKSKEQTIEVDEQVTKAITDQVMESLQPKLDEIEKAHKADKPKNKLKDSKEAKAQAAKDELKNMGKEEFTFAQVIASVNQDHKTLAKLNKFARETQYEDGLINKATYQNAGTDADGGHLVPNAELIRDVLDVLPEYGAVVGELRSLTLTEGDSVELPSVTSGLSMSEVTSEGGTKSTTKASFGSSNVTVREIAGIVLLTKKLVRQSALDVYAIVRDLLADEVAKQTEQLALTDSSSGVTEISDTETTSVGGTSLDDLTYDVFVNAPFDVPAKSARGGIFVLSRELVRRAMTLKDNNDRPIVIMDGGGAGNQSGTIAGYRFVVSEALPTADAADTAYGVFGNFSRYGFLVQQGETEVEVFTSGSVTDGESTEHNLIEENKVALRGEFWRNIGYPVPSAFTVIKTDAA